MSSPASSIPRHASHRYHTTLIAVGLVFAAIGLFGLTAVDSTLPPVTFALLSVFCFWFGPLFVAIGLVGRQVGAGVQFVNTSFDLIARGRFADAEKILDDVDKTNSNALIRCVSAVQRGLIAMRRGDAKAGLGHLDRAIEMKSRLFYRASVRVQTVNARGIRAFLRAATGDRDGARADIEALRQSPDVLPQALARAALAEAICIEREGDRDALRKHLAEHRDLLFDVTDRRERAIVRAFQRMLETSATSVYRKGAKPDTNSEEPPLVDWVAQLVPAAAPFVDPTATKATTSDLPTAIATDGAKQAVTQARKTADKHANKGLSPSAKRMLLYGASIAFFLSTWQLLAPNPQRGGHSKADDSLVLAIVVLILTVGVTSVFAISLVRRVRLALRGGRESRDLFAALNLSAQGKSELATQALTTLTSSQLLLIKAQAHLALASIAERQADLAKSLEHCDQGIACLSQYVLRISASDVLLPDLMSQRAFVLAAMDRHDEAEAELAALPPAYPHRSRALLRVRLVSLARRGDLEGAAKLASEAGLDLPLTARDELLADGVRAAAKPEALTAGELPRIRRELRTIDALRRWLETVAPSALEAVERVTDDVPVQSDEHAAEAEALAEAEAALLNSPLSTQRCEAMRSWRGGPGG